MRFSAPVKKHWLGSFSIVLPPSGVRGFVPVVRDRGPLAGGQGIPWGGGGGWRPGTRDHIYIYTYIDIHSICKKYININPKPYCQQLKPFSLNSES